MLEVPAPRIHACNTRTVNTSGNHVFYWMIANRRRPYNFALQRAVQWAVELRRPLLVVEALSCNYPWASARLHTALLQGMRENLLTFGRSAALYHPFVERVPAHGKGMAHALAG